MHWPSCKKWFVIYLLPVLHKQWLYANLSFFQHLSKHCILFGCRIIICLVPTLIYHNNNLKSNILNCIHELSVPKYVISSLSLSDCCINIGLEPILASASNYLKTLSFWSAHNNLILQTLAYTKNYLKSKYWFFAKIVKMLYRSGFLILHHHKRRFKKNSSCRINCSGKKDKYFCSMQNSNKPVARKAFVIFSSTPSEECLGGRRFLDWISSNIHLCAN